MTTTSEALLNKFTVQTVSFSKDFECRLNIKKRYENILYRSSTSEDRTNIAFIQSDKSTFLNNVFISTNRAQSLIENRDLSDAQIQKNYVKYFNSHQANPLITDVYYGDTQRDIPLFSYHLLSSCNSDLSDWTSRTLINIRFFDKSFQEMSLSEYVYDLNTGRVYNNLANEYSQYSQAFDVTYITYEVEVSSVIETYTEILNNQDTFRVASFEDLDGSGNISVSSKAYISERTGDSYTITLPQLGTYWWKPSLDSQVNVVSPQEKSTSYPWYLSVVNGDFTSVQKNTLSTNKSYRYYIPEFNTQVFSPYPNFKQVADEEAVILGDRLIKTINPPITDTAFYTDIIVLDESSVVLEAYSSDPDKVGQYYNSSVEYTDGLASVDSRSGFIALSGDLPSTYDKVLVSYYYDENKYELTRMNFNALNNLSLLGKRIVFYCMPETLDTGTLSKSLFYLEVDDNGKIIYSEQADLSIGADPPATTKLVTEDFDTSGLPRHDFYYDIESTQSGLDSSFSGVYTFDLDEISFIDKYTTSSRIVETVLASGYMTSSMEQNFIDNPRFLVLGEVSTRSAAGVHEIYNYNARVQGGGIRENDYDTALSKQAEVSWYADSPFQSIYPGMGTFYVQVPKSIHEDWDGELSDDTIREYIQKYMKAGGYGVVDHYGIDPTITSVSSPFSGVIDCVWPHNATGTVYNLYYSTDQKTWISAGSIVDSGIDIYTSITGLDPSTMYYLYAAAVTGTGTEEEGPTVSQTTRS